MGVCWKITRDSAHTPRNTNTHRGRGATFRPHLSELGRTHTYTHTHTHSLCRLAPPASPLSTPTAPPPSSQCPLLSAAALTPHLEIKHPQPSPPAQSARDPGRRRLFSSGKQCACAKALTSALPMFGLLTDSNPQKSQGSARSNMKFCASARFWERG